MHEDCWRAAATRAIQLGKNISFFVLLPFTQVDPAAWICRTDQAGGSSEVSARLAAPCPPLL
jgi:hypothetical protein